MKTDTLKTLIIGLSSVTQIGVSMMAAAVVGWYAAKALYTRPVQVELYGFAPVAWSSYVREGTTNVIRIGTGETLPKQVVRYSPK